LETQDIDLTKLSLHFDVNSNNESSVIASIFFDKLNSSDVSEFYIEKPIN